MDQDEPFDPPNTRRYLQGTVITGRHDPFNLLEQSGLGIRKPYNAPLHRTDGSNSLKKGQLRSLVAGVLSGSKARKRVYLETI